MSGTNQQELVKSLLVPGDDGPRIPRPPSPLKVIITREPYMDDFHLLVVDEAHPNENRDPDHTLDPDETRAWFKAHGANMDVVEKALDYCWNFYRAVAVIKNPTKPLRSQLDPRV